MKFKFKQDSELQIVVGLDEDEEPIFEDEFFPKDEIHDVDLLDEHEDSIDVQFGSGDCCYGLKKSAIEIIERDKDDGA
jgi:hypothetical protein